MYYWLLKLVWFKFNIELFLLYFRHLRRMPHLRYLDIFGVMDDVSVDMLSRALPSIFVCMRPFSSIARPTPSIYCGTFNQNQIWGQLLKCWISFFYSFLHFITVYISRVFIFIFMSELICSWFFFIKCRHFYCFTLRIFIRLFLFLN